MTRCQTQHLHIIDLKKHKLKLESCSHKFTLTCIICDMCACAYTYIMFCPDVYNLAMIINSISFHLYLQIHTRVSIYHIEMNKLNSSYIAYLPPLRLLFMCVHRFTCSYVQVNSCIQMYPHMFT